MIKIKCQMVYLPVSEDYLIDVTDRLIEDVKAITEMIENGKFAFRTTDLSFTFTNIDNFWYRFRSNADIHRKGTRISPVPSYYTTAPYNYSDGGGQVYFGATFVVYQDDNEIYRGDASFEDFSFDVLNQTVTINTYSWHSRLKNMEINLENFGYNLESLLYQIVEYLRGAGTGEWYNKRIFDGFNFDISGVLEFDFDPELAGTELGYRSTGERDITSYQRDVWQNPSSKKIYGLAYGKDESPNEWFVSILRDNGIIDFVLLNLDELFGAATTITVIKKPEFLRACHKKYVALACYLDLRIPTTTGRTRAVIGTKIIKIDVETKEVEVLTPSVLGGLRSDEVDFSTLALFEDGTVYNFGAHVISDGDFFYTVMPIIGSSDSLLLTKYTSPGTGINWTLTGATDVKKVFAPHKNLITWYNTDTWFFATFGGATNVGQKISIPKPVAFSIKNKGWNEATAYDESLPVWSECTFYPTGSDNPLLNGIFSYGFLRGGGALGIIFDFDWTFCNDPVHQIMSCLEYKDLVSPEEIISDISQLFNAYYTIKNGVIKFYNRTNFGTEFLLSEDWIKSEEYIDDQSDSIGEDANLSLKSTGFYDDPENPYDRTCILGVIRYFYKKSLGRFINKNIIIPASEGNKISLGDKITVNETGFSGVVYEKEWTKGTDGYFCKFLIKSKYDLTPEKIKIFDGGII